MATDEAGVRAAAELALEYLCELEGEWRWKKEPVARPRNNKAYADLTAAIETVRSAVAANPADPTPITPEGLAGLGFVRHQQPAAGRALSLDTGDEATAIYFDGAGRWAVGMGWIPDPLSPKTMGDVRRLLTSLGQVRWLVAAAVGG